MKTYLISQEEKIPCEMCGCCNLAEFKTTGIKKYTYYFCQEHFDKINSK